MKAGLGILISILSFIPNPASQAWAEPSAGTVWTEPTTGMKFVWVPGGCFRMGAGDNRSEMPIHEVCVRGFWLGRHEVTQREYEQIVGSNPSYFKEDDRPAEQVSWDEANAFAAQIGKKIGSLIRLPSEAEWEYACRAGGQHDAFLRPGPVGSGWFGSNSGTRTHRVEQKQANAWGLYDMSGNVSEWVLDCGTRITRGLPRMGAPGWETELAATCFRGGAWFDSMPFLHAAYRSKYQPSSRFSYLGFRLVMTQGSPNRQ